MKNWDYIHDLGQRRGLSSEDVGNIIAESCLPNWKTLHMHGPSAYQNYVYAVVRIARPETLVETGVRYGVGTTHILAALKANGAGHLVSCDPMHKNQLEAMKQIHELCKTEMDLFARWRFFGVSSQAGEDGLLVSSNGYPVAGTVLHKMLGTATDIFVHDSDHCFDHMTWELETALPKVRPGGLIICDDWDWREHSELHRHRDGNVVEQFAARHNLVFSTVGTAAVFER